MITPFLIGYLLHRQTATVTGADFDPSLAFGAKKLEAWHLPIAPESLRPTLDDFGGQLLDRAVKDLDKENNPEWKARFLGDAANNYIFLDPEIARSSLQKAWTLTTTIPSNAGITQTGLIKIWCGIDAPHAKALVQKVNDSYWLDFSNDYLANYLGTYNFTACAPLFESQEAGRREQHVTELAYDLMYEDPSAAVQMVRHIKGVNQDKVIAAVVYILADDSLTKAEPLINEIKSPDERDSALASIINKVCDDYPDRAAATALLLKKPRSRATACAKMVRVFSRTSPEKARFMQHEALESIKNYKGEYADYAPNWLLPDVACVDSTEVREFLTKLEKPALADDAKWGDTMHLGTMPSQLLRVAGAWAQIDQPKAESLINAMLKVKPHGLIDYSDIGNSINDGYENYLVVVARHDPQHAAELLKPLLEDGDRMVKLSVSSIAQALVKHDAPQARLFAQAMGDKSIVAAVDARAAYADIKNHPEAAFNLVPKTQQLDFMYENLDQSSLAMDAARAFVKRGDLASAIKLSTLVSPSDSFGGNSQSVVLQSIAWALLRNNQPDKVMDVLKLADNAISKDPPSGGRASALIDLAGEILKMSGHHHWKD